jgi:hypothetical protein
VVILQSEDSNSVVRLGTSVSECFTNRTQICMSTMQCLLELFVRCVLMRSDFVCLNTVVRLSSGLYVCGMFALHGEPHCRWGNVVYVTYRTVSFGAKLIFLNGRNNLPENK